MDQLPGTLISFEGFSWDAQDEGKVWLLAAGQVVKQDEEYVYLADASGQVFSVPAEELQAYQNEGGAQVHYMRDARLRPCFPMADGNFYRASSLCDWLHHPRADRIASCYYHLDQLQQQLEKTPDDQALRDDLTREKLLLQQLLN